MTNSSQKFISRNRAPRVQIEYDVELYGSEKKVQLPFVMGVMSDLAGKSTVAQPSIDERRFLEIDVDNFDDRMRAMQPRAAFSVPNTLTGEGNIDVDLTFEKMADFSPEAIAAKVAPLRSLLEARTQLSNLMTYMDGKVGAETLIEKILGQPALLSALAGSEQNASESTAALDSLRSMATEERQQANEADSVLGGLKSNAVVEDAPKDNSADVLAALSQSTVDELETVDPKADVLANLRDSAPTDESSEDKGQAALEKLRAISLTEDAPDTSVDDALAGLANAAPDEGVEPDTTASALETLAQAEIPEAPKDESDALLAGLAASVPEETSETNDVDAALDSLAKVETEVPTDNGADDTLAGLAAAAPDEMPEPDDVGAALSSLAAVEVTTPTEDTTDDALAGLAAAAPEETLEADDVGAALESLNTVEVPAPAEDTTDDALAGLAAAAPEEMPAADDVDAALDSLAEIELPAVAADMADDALAGLAGVAPQVPPQADDVGAALDSLGEAQDARSLEDTTAETLAGLADAAPEESPQENDLDDTLDRLASVEVEETLDDGSTDVLADLANAPPEEPPQPDDIGLALDSLSTSGDGETTPETTVEADLDDLLGDSEIDIPGGAADELDDALGLDEGGSAPDFETDGEVSASEAEDGAAEPDELDDLLGDLDALDLAEVSPSALDPITDLPEAGSDDGAVDPLDDLLGDLDDVEPAGPVTQDTELLVGDTVEESSADGLDDLFGELEDSDAPSSVTETDEPLGLSDVEESPADDLDDLLVDLNDSDAPDSTTQAADPRDASEVEEGPPDGLDDLDDLLGDLSEPDVADTPVSDTENVPADDLDDLLGDLNEPEEPQPTAPVVDLDDLLSEAPANDASGDAKPAGEPEFAFGVMTGERPDAARLNRKRFRIALMGDFSGRAARGQLETGDALAARKAILLDPDTIEDVVESFGTTLVLPIGREGAGVEVKLGGLDDLHPDELYENVPILTDLQGLRSQLANGSTAANAAQRLKAWGEAYGTPVAPPKTRSGGNAVPANLKLSEFQKLIGDTSAELTTASPVEDMIAQIVGPHVRAVADADTVAMQDAVDEALSAAMRLILHHPEFQSIEAQWRTLDLIARSIETDDTLELMLYDISAEEIGADLAAAEDLSQSGIVRLLTEAPLDPENGRGGYSAIIGLYTFEETPPHAELLGRIARVAAHVDAPFVAALSPTFMDTAKEDRHPLVATAWDTLRAMPEAGYLGLAAPRFLLRRPYGAKSEPIYEFDLEEFTMATGLRGMLWANPVVLVAILLAKSYKENGAHLGLGSIMSLGGMPYHFVTDQYGDQVALPCTERNLTLEKVEKVMARGVMPVVSFKGRDEIRLASFQSLAGGDILGPWSDVPPPPPSPPKPAHEPAGDAAVAEDDDLGLDDLLAGFDDDAAPDADPGDVDADLAALLEDL